MYRLFLWGSKLAPSVPRLVRQWLAGIIGTLAWVFAAGPRGAVTANVRQVLGASTSGQGAIVRRIFRNCVDNYLELLARPGVPTGQAAAELHLTGIEHLEEALKLGRGVVLFSAHLGPFDYVSSWFSAHGHKVVIPVEKTADADILRLMVELRRSNGVQFVPLNGPRAVRMMFEALRENRMVLVAADRPVAGETVTCDFFGASAAMPAGPVSLSLRTGAPLVGAFGWRKSDGSVGGAFVPLTLALPQKHRDDAQFLQTALVRVLERMIAAHIDEWVVFTPIWRR